MDGAKWIMWFVKNDIMSHITGKDWQNKQSASVKKYDPNTPEWTKITICNCKRDLQRFISCFSFTVNTRVFYYLQLWVQELVTLDKHLFAQWCIWHVKTAKCLFKVVMAFFGQVSCSHVILHKYFLQSSPYKWRQSHWGNYFPHHSGDNNTK